MDLIIKDELIKQIPLREMNLSQDRILKIDANLTTVNTCFENNPFSGKIFYKTNMQYSTSRIVELLNNYRKLLFDRLFIQLNQELGIQVDTSKELIKEKIAEATKKKELAENHYKNMETVLLSFNDLFDTLSSYGTKYDDSVNIDHAICLVEIIIGLWKIKTWNERKKYIYPIALITKANFSMFNFELPQILEEKYLLELFFAMPVWFNFKGNDSETFQRWRDSLDLPNNFTDLFKIYNVGAQGRPWHLFPNIDPLPSDWEDTCNKVKIHKLFDYNFVVSPYLHIATQEMAEIKEKRAIQKEIERQKLKTVDPIHIGAHKNIPYITLLKRWSKNDIFPEIPLLIANTIKHLEMLTSSFGPGLLKTKEEKKVAKNCLRAFKKKILFNTH